MSATYPRISKQLDDPETAREEGRRKIDWARQHMPILETLREEFEESNPFDEQRIGMAMHVEAKTAALVETLAAGGAEVVITGCNPLSTHDDVSAALDAQPNITSYAKHDISDQEYYDAIETVIAIEPTITVDDGGDLVFRIHDKHPDLIENIIGGCEETTTGVHRLRSMDADGALEYPVFAVNDTPMKRLFDNVHGTGESSLANIAMTTNLSFAGKTVVVAGYGDCGRGIAKKAAGQNAHVIVCEVDPRRALEAHMEGYEVMSMREAAPKGDVFITVTGNRDVITREDFERMHDGVLLANAGHFDIEVNLDDLSDLAVNVSTVRDGVREYELQDGRRLNVLAEGRLVNLAGPLSLGHPVEVMDQSFGVQAVCIRELVGAHSTGLPDRLLSTIRNRIGKADGPRVVADRGYEAGVNEVPDALDREVASIKLGAEGITIDELTDVQDEYANSWQHGT